MAVLTTCFTIPNETLTIVSRTDVIATTTTDIFITLSAHNQTVPIVTCVPVRNDDDVSSEDRLPPPSCTTTTLFSTTLVPGMFFFSF